MDITTVLSQIWGPVLLAIGLGIFVSPRYYQSVYRDLEKETLATLTFGMVAVMVGVIQIGIHNVWQTLPQVIISIIGWGTLLKGLVFLVAPRFADRAGNFVANSKMLSLIGAVVLILGVYVSWVGYIA